MVLIFLHLVTGGYVNASALRRVTQVGKWTVETWINWFFCLFEAAKKALSVEIPNENVIYEMCLYTCELKGENNATCDIVVF